MTTILVVDDATSIREMVSRYLETEGFRTVSAADGRAALGVAEREKPDLVVLDVMMPEMDGYAFLREFRRASDAPVIMLTAKLEEVDKVLGLELGADDYMTKPFGLRELTARVRAVLRRTDRRPAGRAAAPADGRNLLRAADVVLDRDSHSVTVADRRVELTPSEFGLLAALMTTPGRVYSRLELLEKIQGSAYEGYERTIDVHVRNLRRKIEPRPHQPHYVETIYGLGYRFTAD